MRPLKPNDILKPKWSGRNEDLKWLNLPTAPDPEDRYAELTARLTQLMQDGVAFSICGWTHAELKCLAMAANHRRRQAGWHRLIIQIEKPYIHFKVDHDA